MGSFSQVWQQQCNSRTEIINAATDFYANLYRQPDTQNQNMVSYSHTGTSPIHQFTENEVLKQITRLKPEKSPGPDGITNECIKVAKNLLLTPITILWNKILDEEAVPHQWMTSEIILLYKKGDPADIGNYRPISLMSCFYKLFASSLLERIAPVIDAHQPIEKAGFRSGFSTMDHIQVVDQVSTKIGLEMNLDKTKIMSNRRATPILTINNTPLESVNHYIYLGKQISFSKERNTEELNRRVAITWNKFWYHKEILKSQLPLQAKKIVMDTGLLPCLTYGCQTWIFDLKTRNKIQSTQRKMERSCQGIKLKDKMKNVDIRKKTKVRDALTFAMKAKWKWAGHAARYKDDRWTLRSVKWSGPKGTRPRGRPKARWADEIVACAGGSWIKRDSPAPNDREDSRSLGEAFTRTGSMHLLTTNK
ncbi:uncharacterized protein LOC133319855 [Danaus plexippus]|uniref:uncharacterized protein LOC133319855 n=1 Tax=Danaus plexippus TaxID=13037 RepID=UPI002AB21F34|nr:uncharacterized protein LOC133319855 [Danaus plexippus]